jgi:hypothetical protein
MRSIALGGAVAVGAAVARKRMLQWGSTPEERTMSLPGDELVAHADATATRAVTIAAPVADVWPWIVQLGQGRGGLYSYDFLENLVGCEMHSADHVAPEWQSLAVGDHVRLHPEVALEVAVLEPGQALVLRGGVPMGSMPPPYDFSWAFVLLGGPPDAARLVVRERYGYSRRWSALLVEPVQVVSFVMSRRMLRGIRERAERGGIATPAFELD